MRWICCQVSVRCSKSPSVYLPTLTKGLLYQNYQSMINYGHIPKEGNSFCPSFTYSKQLSNHKISSKFMVFFLDPKSNFLGILFWYPTPSIKTVSKSVNTLQIIWINLGILHHLTSGFDVHWLIMIFPYWVCQKMVYTPRQPSNNRDNNDSSLDFWVS